MHCLLEYNKALKKFGLGPGVRKKSFGYRVIHHSIP